MTEVPPAPAVPRARWHLPRPTLVWAIAVAWAVAVAAQATGRGRALHHDALAEGGLPIWAALGLFLLAWQLMIAAMMLPSSLPMIRLFSRASANQPRPPRAKAAFLGGYAGIPEGTCCSTTDEVWVAPSGWERATASSASAAVGR